MNSETHKKRPGDGDEHDREHNLRHGDLAPDAAEAVPVEPEEVGVEPSEPLHDEQKDDQRDDDRDDDDVPSPGGRPEAPLG